MGKKYPANLAALLKLKDLEFSKAGFPGFEGFALLLYQLGFSPKENSMDLIQTIPARELYAGARTARFKNDWRLETITPVVIVSIDKIIPAVITEKDHQVWFPEDAVHHGADEAQQKFLLEQTAILASAHARELALQSAVVKVHLEG